MKPLSILVVDNEPAICELLTQMLEVKGHVVKRLGDARKAVELVGEHHFDLIITDILMPEMDGVEFIMELRRKNPSLHIIAMSGGGHIPSQQLLKIAKGSGAQALMDKPFSSDQLFAAIDSVMGGATK